MGIRLEFKKISFVYVNCSFFLQTVASGNTFLNYDVVSSKSLIWILYPLKYDDKGRWAFFFFSLIEHFSQKLYLAETGIFDLKNFWPLTIILNYFFLQFFCAAIQVTNKPRNKLVKFTGKLVLFSFCKIYTSYLFRIIFSSLVID